MMQWTETVGPFARAKVRAYLEGKGIEFAEDRGILFTKFSGTLPMEAYQSLRRWLTANLGPEED